MNRSNQYLIHLNYVMSGHYEDGAFQTQVRESKSNDHDK
jgi:hypothetical protein